MRGPGETQLETDRRLIGQRVRVLTKRLEKIRQQRETGRAARAEIPGSVDRAGRLHERGQVDALPLRHRGGCLGVADQLFATLDPDRPSHHACRAARSRCWRTPSGSSASCRTSW